MVPCPVVVVDGIVGILPEGSDLEVGLEVEVGRVRLVVVVVEAVVVPDFCLQELWNVEEDWKYIFRFTQTS